MKNIVLSLCLYIFCFLVIGLYTLIIYLIGQTFWPEKTKGSLIIDKNSNIRGSYLVAQYLQDTRYFKPRPNIEADPECDMALYNTDFKRALIHNYDKQLNHSNVIMITPSASLYDPFITKAEAILQALMVAKTRGVDVNKIYKLIEQNTLYKQKIFFEIEIVNTSILNDALDDYSN
jgi:K+-transporting ATPase ATPase C chain